MGGKWECEMDLGGGGLIGKRPELFFLKTHLQNLPSDMLHWSLCALCSWQSGGVCTSDLETQVWGPEFPKKAKTFQAISTTFTKKLLFVCALSLQPFHPMVNLQCSPELRMFLCSLYAPVCSEYGRITLPCRRLCLQAKSDCYRLMDMFGVSWPEEMDCNRLSKHSSLSFSGFILARTSNLSRCSFGWEERQ